MIVNRNKVIKYLDNRVIKSNCWSKYLDKRF